MLSIDFSGNFSARHSIFSGLLQITFPAALISSYVSESPLLSRLGKWTSCHSDHLHFGLQGVMEVISPVVYTVSVEGLAVVSGIVVVGAVVLRVEVDTLAVSVTGVVEGVLEVMVLVERVVVLGSVLVGSAVVVEEILVTVVSGVVVFVMGVVVSSGVVVAGVV